MKSAQKHKKFDNEAELFAAEMKDVKPMKPHNVAEREPMKRSQATLKESRLGNTERMDDSISEFVRPGIQKAVLRRLRNGQIQIEDELDLHGYTANETERCLRMFLYAAQVPGRQRAVRVIHGKGLGSPDGKPVLKYKVVDCLRGSDAVLAFCLARLSEGGSGAVHVLLKRR
jgi:DNA-nicking Smr family endonuclease